MRQTQRVKTIRSLQRRLRLSGEDLFRAMDQFEKLYSPDVTKYISELIAKINREIEILEDFAKNAEHIN